MRSLIHSRRGQTLVEALIALSILTIGFLGIITLLTKSFQLNRTTTDDTQATYLASEGIEVAKNLIDHDVYEQLSPNPSYAWGTCFPNSGYYYPIDYMTTDCAKLTFSPSDSAQANTPLYYNPTTFSFTANAFGANPTDFVRTIKITNVSGNEIDVQSTVKWTNGLLSNSITLEDHFYNWHPAPVPPTVVLSASTLNVSAPGDPVTITWNASNATACSGVGGPALSGSVIENPLVKTTYSITCTGSDGSQTQQVTVTVGAAAGPAVTLIASTLNTSAPGDPVTLTWNSIGAVSCSGLGSATSGVVTENPLVNTTYSITCADALGNSTLKQVTVTVGAVIPPSNSVQNFMIGLDDNDKGIAWPSGSPPNVGVIRLWDDGVRWNLIDPNCSNVGLNTSTVTSWLNYAQANNIPIINFTGGIPPNCAYSSMNPYVMNPAAVDQFLGVITNISATRKAAGQRGIDYYEPINEPDNATSGGGADLKNPLNLALYMQEAYNLIKGKVSGYPGDPTAKIIGPTISYCYSSNGDKEGFQPCPYGVDDYLTEAKTLPGSGYPFVDILSYHNYLDAYSTGVPPEGVMKGINGMKAIEQSFGLNIPIVNTEFSWSKNILYSPDYAYQEDFLARSYILFEANDVGMWWYEWGNAQYGGLISSSSPGFALPPATTYKVVTGWLLGSTLGTPVISGSTNNVYTVSITLANGKQGLLLWDTNGNSTYNLPAQLQGGLSYEDANGVTRTAGASTVTIGQLPILIDK